MIELTPKEVKNIGFNRYLMAKWRFWKAVGLALVGYVLAVLFMNYTEGHVGDVVQMIIGCAIILLGASYFILSYWRAEKAGKKFLEQWQKEGGR